MSKVRIASTADLVEPGCQVYQVNGHILALFKTDQGLFAADNRCPHNCATSLQGREGI